MFSVDFLFENGAENSFFHHISRAEMNRLCENGLGGSFMETLILSRELLMSFLALAF